MECRTTQDLLSEFLEGTLPEREQEEVSAHLRLCPPCEAARDGLRETLLLLGSLPPEKAPPELLEGVRRRIRRKERSATLWKRLFLPAHVKLPVEAAAVAILVLLAYVPLRETAKVPSGPGAPPGTSKGTPPTAGPDRTAKSRSLAPQARVSRAGAAPTRAAAPSSDAERKPDSGHRSAQRPPAPAPPRERGSADASRSYSTASLPSVPATRVSSAGETIEPSAPSGRAAADVTQPARVFAAPPSRLSRPTPYGRDVLLVIAPEEASGWEERVAAAARHAGGTVVGQVPGSETPARTADSVRVHVPAASAAAFLDELRTFGTIPPEGVPRWSDLPAGPAPGIASYTVRIRVR